MISKPEKAKVEIFNSNSWDAKFSSPIAEGSYRGFNSNTDKVRKKQPNEVISKDQQAKITSSIRRCYSQDVLAKNYRLYVTSIVITVDETGTARTVKFDAATQVK